MQKNILFIFCLFSVSITSFGQTTKQSDLVHFLEEYPTINRMTINKSAPKSSSKSMEDFFLICKTDVDITWGRTLLRTSSGKKEYNSFHINKSNKFAMLFCGSDGTFSFKIKTRNKTAQKWIEHKPINGNLKDLPSKIKTMINTPTWKFGRL